MVNYIIVQAAINYTEACMLKNNSDIDFEKRASNEAYTRSFKDFGITKLGIWVNLEKIFIEPNNVRNCALKATINCSSFFKNGVFDIGEVSKRLAILKLGLPKESKALSWNIQTICFTKQVNCSNPLIYKKLLLNNFCQNNKSFKNIIETHDEQQTLTYINQKGAKLLDLTFDENHNCITLNLTIQKKKLENIKKSNNYPFTSRSLCDNTCNLDELEKTLWYSYLNSAGGSADYYSYNASEQIIEKLNVSHKSKQQMYSVLKGIALYKTVANYLDHVDKQTVIYKDINTIKTKSCALKYIHMLSNEAHINPINLSRRTASKIKTDTLKNLITLMGIDVEVEKKKNQENRKREKQSKHDMFTITDKDCPLLANL
ncbi:MAG: hypothetical protein IJA34_16955 [Lachnospiraceae bacterium]|nr:hypothetical protein [Lachnospiraceae bacterium]